MTRRIFGIVVMLTFAAWIGASIYLLVFSQAMRHGVMQFFGLR